MCTSWSESGTPRGRNSAELTIANMAALAPMQMPSVSRAVTAKLRSFQRVRTANLRSWRMRSMRALYAAGSRIVRLVFSNSRFCGMGPFPGSARLEHQRHEGFPDYRQPRNCHYDRRDEDCDVERERNPRASGPGAGMARTRAARRRVPAGDQGLDRPAPGLAVRDGRVLVLLARREGLLGRRPAREQADRRDPAGVRPSGVRL